VLEESDLEYGIRPANNHHRKF